MFIAIFFQSRRLHGETYKKPNLVCLLGCSCWIKGLLIHSLACGKCSSSVEITIYLSNPSTNHRRNHFFYRLLDQSTGVETPENSREEKLFCFPHCTQLQPPRKASRPNSLKQAPSHRLFVGRFFCGKLLYINVEVYLISCYQGQRIRSGCSSQGRGISVGSFTLLPPFEGGENRKNAFLEKILE